MATGATYDELTDEIVVTFDAPLAPGGLDESKWGGRWNNVTFTVANANATGSTATMEGILGAFNSGMSQITYAGGDAALKGVDDAIVAPFTIALDPL